MTHVSRADGVLSLDSALVAVCPQGAARPGSWHLLSVHFLFPVINRYATIALKYRSHGIPVFPYPVAPPEPAGPGE